MKVTKGNFVRTIAIASGGTAGHVLPALTLAIALREKGYQIIWIGSDRFEAVIVPQNQFRFYSVLAKKKKGRVLPFRVLRFFRAIYHSFQFLRSNKADLVLGFGNYISLPSGIAAFLSGTDLMIHEQNTVVGLANRTLSIFAKKRFATLPILKDHRDLFLNVGVPMSEQAISIARESRTKRLRGEFHTPFRILILGGSQGSSLFNSLLPKILGSLAKKGHKFEFHHQTGEKEFTECLQLYQNLGLEGDLFSFDFNLAFRYQWADFVICRAGALTLSELVAFALPALILPISKSRFNHQRKNAEYFGDRGAAICLKGANSSDKIELVLESVLQNPKKMLSPLTERLFNLVQLDGIRKIINAIELHFSE